MQNTLGEFRGRIAIGNALARTDYILITHLMNEKANGSDAHNTLRLERTVLLMANHD